MFDLYSIFAYANTAACGIVDFFFLHNTLHRKRGNLFHTILYWLFMTIVSSAVYTYCGIFGLPALSSYVMLIVYGIIFLGGNLGEKVLMPAIAVSLMGAVDTLTTIIFALFSGDRFAQLRQSPLYPFVGTIMSMVIFVLIILYLSRLKWQVGLLDKGTLFLLCSIPIACFMMLMLYNNNRTSENITSPFMLVSALSLISISVFSLVIFNKLSRNIVSLVNTEVQLQVAKKKLSTEEETHAVYQSMQRIRHDYTNHLIAIKKLYKANKYDKLGEYLNHVVDIPDVAVELSTGNAIIDAVVGTKVFIAEQKGITICAVIAVPSEMSVSDADLCSVLGNILDNAIEATSKLDSLERKIRLEIRAVKNYLSIECVNPTNGNCVPSDDGLFLTTKGNKSDHGHGLEMIRRIAKSYKGYFRCEHVNNQFSALAMLLAINNTDKNLVYKVNTLNVNGDAV